MSPLESILGYAIAQVPRYRGLPRRLTCFPVLDKRAAQADPAAYLSDELGSQKAALAQFLADADRASGPNQETVFDGHIIVEETSGSSGMPFRTPKTRAERARMSYAIWGYRRKFDPQCSSKHFYPIFHRPAATSSLGRARDFTTQGIDAFYRQLTGAGIRWVHAGANILRRHAELISPDAAGAKSVRFAENTSLTLHADDRRCIEEKLQVSLLDQYGCREAWAMGIRATTAPFEVLGENVVVELLDDDGQPIVCPSRQGRIVVTGLHQKVFPLLRYDTGDLGCWAENAVGRKFLLSNHRQHHLLRHQHQVVDGNELFRKLLSQAHRQIGYTPVRYIQIRQVAPKKFVLAISESSNAQSLLAALRELCARHDAFCRDSTIDLLQLSAAALADVAEQKPALFTTKHLSALP